MILLLSFGALAADEPDLKAKLSGDVKSFLVASFPYEHLLMPPDPSGQATVDGRLKLKANYRDLFRFDLHHAATVVSAPVAESVLGSEASQFTLTGAGGSAPEAIDLSWEVEDTGPALTIAGRVDRAVLTAMLPRVEVALGRQPISFGSGQFFTPMDVVNPFHPATIDQEYKPGVDSLRVDGYAGVGGQVTAVAAYAGDWTLDGFVLAANGRATVGVTDLTALLGAVHGEPVVGAGTLSSLGPVAVHADATLTFPEDQDAFVRAVAGADWRPTGTTTLGGEVYVQTFGASDPEQYLQTADSEPW